MKGDHHMILRVIAKCMVPLILIYGFYEYPSFAIKLAANIPHLALGGVALAAALFGRR